LALGLLFVPCAGPVLAAVTVVGATHRVGLSAVALTIAFALGAAVPLLAVAITGSQLTHRLKSLRRRAPALRRAGGVVLVGMALAIAFNAFAGLQRDLPGYTTALQNKVEGSATVRKELGSLTGETGSLSKCPPASTGLVSCGPAPNFTNITAWLNTPSDRPLSISGLRGKVVLIDFWTYSCINCQRSLPHVEAWYSRYAKYGLEIVGVSTPEFSFEHVVSNVRAAAGQLGIHYPIAVDDNYGTWNAYDNEYWPAEYLIGSNGLVRHIDFGEGNYTSTESFIRQLLTQAHPGIKLPPPTSVANETPTEPTSPETYLGYDRAEYLVPGTELKDNAAAGYKIPASLPLGAFGLSGTWTARQEDLTAGGGAELELDFQAEHVYLVMSGAGSVNVLIDGRRTQRLIVSGVPRLYTLFSSASLTDAKMLLQFTPGVAAYDFTFG
jgi:thiol-disulfide isomerase/thioredoxin